VLNLFLNPWMVAIIQGITQVIAAILQATVLHPYVFDGSTVPADIWQVTDHIAWAGAGVLFIWECLQYIWHPWTGSRNSPSQLIGRTVLAVLLAQSSYWLLDLMLQVNDAMVSTLLHDFATLGPLNSLGALASNTSLPFWILVVVLIFLAGVLGIVFSWAARVAELILLVAIAPVAAILSLTDSFRGSWRWLIREAASAAFAQSMWALTVTLMLWSMEGGVIGSASGITDPGVQLALSCIVGLGFVALSFKSQRWLKGLLFGQQVADGSHGVAELAAVYMAARTVSGAYGAQIGSAMGQLGIGRYSQGWMQTEAARSVQSAQVAAQPAFAVPMSVARSQGAMAAMRDPEARDAMQSSEAMQQMVNADPMVAAANATRSQVNKRARSVGGHSRAAMYEGGQDARSMFEAMYPRPAPPGASTNPYTGRDATQYLSDVQRSLLPGKTTYGVPVEPLAESGGGESE